MDEVTNASIHQVSLRGALWEVSIGSASSLHQTLINLNQGAFPEQTIDGLRLDNIDQHGSLSPKIFRHYARIQLPSMQPLLEARLEEAFATEIGTHNYKDGGSFLL